MRTLARLSSKGSRCVSRDIAVSAQRPCASRETRRLVHPPAYADVENNLMSDELFRTKTIVSIILMTLLSLRLDDSRPGKEDVIVRMS